MDIFKNKRCLSRFW